MGHLGMESLPGPSSTDPSEALQLRPLLEAHTHRATSEAKLRRWTNLPQATEKTELAG